MRYLSAWSSLCLLTVAPAALADTWGPYEDGFVSPARADAPLDGQIVYAANYPPRATATDSGGTAVALESVHLTGVGALPRIAFLPPPSGWASGETYNLSVLGYYEEDGEVATFSFTAGSAVAPPPADVTVGAIQTTEWSEEQTYAWGCCEPVRTVTVDVSVPGADPWGWVELVGEFDLGRPSQITTQEVHTHLDVEVGPGDHQLVFDQWLDDRGPQPPCFDVVAVSAAGVRGPAQSFCTDAPSDTASDTGSGTASYACGCRSGAGAGAGFGVLAALLLARRRRQAAGGSP